MTEPKPMDPNTDVSELSGNCVHNHSDDGPHVKQSNVPNGCVRHIGNDNGLIMSKSIASVSLSVKVNDIDKTVKSPSPEKADADRVSAGADTSKSKDTVSESQADRVSETVGNHESAEESLSDALAKTSLAESDTTPKEVQRELHYVVYESEHQMPDIMRLITKDLSEPYSIYTYRYFIHNWPKLCFLAMDGSTCVGAIVCKLDLHKKMVRRGYIAMLAVDQNYRRCGIGSHLVMKAIRAMVADDCDEVVLETEITNKAALRLYENLGFVRDKRLFRYYLNGVDALRLKLWLR